MNRRNFCRAGLAAAMGNRLVAQDARPDADSSVSALSPSGLKIVSVRMVDPQPRKALPEFTPSADAWSPFGSEVASPMSIYSQYKPKRSLFMADDLGKPAVEILTDKGIRGIGFGGPGAGFVIENHLQKLLIGEDPFRIEQLWDIMWRSTLYYGRKGIAIHAISAVDNALWDLVGNALKTPVYQLIGGPTKDRIPAYCTGNDIEQHVEFGFTKLKLAVPFGPADGREGMRKNVALVKRARDLLGPDGEIMLDCWMAFTERYTVEFAKLLKPYRVYWMEECLPPDNYTGMQRLNTEIDSTRLATGEHEYTRYGFQLLKHHDAADIWQPDMRWCGGLSELRRIGAMAAAEDIPIILHGGARAGASHYTFATTNSPWCEMFMPPPGGPTEIYERYEEEYNITRGPEGIYMRPPDRPGFGFQFNVA